MKAETLFAAIAERYGTAPDYPFAHFPEYAVFRHGGNRKWFAAYLPVPAEKLGRTPGRNVPLLNVKCRPEHIGAMRAQAGILPAYHMNKEHWLSIELARADEALIRQLLDDSFRLTQGRPQGKKKAG
ncbi:MmcQ/YjbR family DNA-binding protein [Eikenella sp. S3360]|uniref:MmcQ/YjbR family DNA-binding protein n=1 Tax=Eikenella glucosivorans TaxID=2766967 RepID=A0ABS0N765_9NEIS|nr:MmcQ/YjbR family DNA-binding protein [Eikenella glucosivorans]MBH5328131.1 MmcQ/YjbR family DNA-binding protein [Eikenella glucosivorans]